MIAKTATGTFALRTNPDHDTKKVGGALWGCASCKRKLPTREDAVRCAVSDHTKAWIVRSDSVVEFTYTDEEKEVMADV